MEGEEEKVVEEEVGEKEVYMGCWKNGEAVERGREERRSWGKKWRRREGRMRERRVCI